MSTYIDEKRRRTEQFAEYLRLMGLRRHKITRADCFVIFDDSPPADAESPKVKESVAITVDSLAGGGSASGDEEPEDGIFTAWPEGESQARYVQFAFRRDCFYMELPSATLFLPEAEQILRHRSGFYWAKNRLDLRWVRSNWKDIVRWNPLQKVYLYRDEQSAAEDMAFILFQVWHFPVDSPLYMTASTFGTGPRFERGKQV
jgi:hypothetical protein